MSQHESTHPPAWPRSRIVTWSLVLLGFCLLILLAAMYTYHAALQDETRRTDCLIAIMVAGAGATACLAGIIYLVDRPLCVDPEALPRWYIRLPLGELKRLVMILQLATIGLSLAAAAILIFGFKLPRL